MKGNERHRLDQLLDLLADEVAERLRAGPRPVVPASRPEVEGAVPQSAPEPEGSPATDGEAEAGEGRAVAPRDRGPGEEPGLQPKPRAGPEGEAASPPPVPFHTTRLLGRLALGLAVLVVLINVPINRHGTTLATAMPDTRALVFRDGLVVKEEDDPEIYVYENGEFRWISSLNAFERRGYTWEDVHVVDDGFLDEYPIGAPIHVLLKCPESPHIYRLEAEEKRWIVDIAAFEAAGHIWEDVRFVSCAYLRGLPDGETIPPGHGPPPQP